jgi:hypothetical protein
LEKLAENDLNYFYPGHSTAAGPLIWFSGFRGEDLNVIFYQNMSNLYNWHKSVEKKISEKNS